MRTPEELPVVFATHVEVRITGEASAGEGVVLPAGGEPAAHGIVEDILGGELERAAFALGFAEDVVVGLALPVGRREKGTEVLAEKFDRDVLVGGFFVETEPEQMNVVGHQHIGGTGERIAGAGVKEHEFPRVVERRSPPTRGTVFEGERPVDEGAAAVVFGR